MAAQGSDSKTLSISLPDGRTLSYGIYGATAPGARTVFYFHGFPASHHEAAVLDDAARAADVRIVAPSRPGMCRSTFQPGRAITHWPTDVLALADHAAIRADTFGVLGASGGAPYVLACCAALPASRLRAAGILSGLYPASLGLQGMLLEARLLLWLAPWSTGLVQRMLDWSIGAAAAAAAATTTSDANSGNKLEMLMDHAMRTRPGPDRRAWEENEGGLRDMLVTSVQNAFPADSGGGGGGARGAAWEAKLLGCEWGFELTDVNMGEGRLVLWHGKKDVNSPLAMAEKAHAMLAGSEIRIECDEAHMSLLLHKLHEALAVLKERMS